MSSETPTTRHGARKVQIPRMPRTGFAQSPTKDRRRVPRACTACRNHKIKCTGDNPQCKHCESVGRECVYILPRKDRLKIITERCAQMAGLLSAMRGRADEEESARIGELLDAVEEDISETRQGQVPVPSSSEPDVDRSNEPTAMSDASPFDPRDLLEPMDTESLDLLDEDLLKDERARATGFVGKSSELQWLRSIMLQLERDSETSDQVPSSYGMQNIEQVSAFNFYLNRDAVDFDIAIDPRILPTPETAECLLESYMSTVHDSFPILPRKQFESEFRKYFQAVRTGNAPHLSSKWQAILNLVFAIGAKHSHLVKAKWRADEADHLVYQARARGFGLNEYTLTSHPDVPQIQVSGMLAFYYLSVGQISRQVLISAWIIVGVALRFAYSLGLHVRNEDPSASDEKKEMLIRIWWSLYSLERLLSIMTGRPSIIVDQHNSVPLPSAHPEDQVSEELVDDEVSRHAPMNSMSLSFDSSFSHDMLNPSLVSHSMGAIGANRQSYFRGVVELGIISQNILSSLYSAGTMIRSLADIQQDMVQLSQRLDRWVVSLPSALNFQLHDPRSRSNLSSWGFLRERLLLGFLFCSARILLTRPCLFSLNQSQTAADVNFPSTFIQRMADVCVDAAKTATDFLPDQINPLLIYETGPWWSIVHNMMQAVSVFLLGLSYSVPGSQEVLVLSQYVKKLVRWLRMMKDPLAERAYQMAFSTLQAVAARLSLDISDLWAEDSMEYRNSDFQGTQVGVYGTGRENLSDDAHDMATSMFTSFNAMPAQTFQQQNTDPSFDSPYFQDR
ncbi:hypothetical protein K504DRAFT_531255 [Pleomassaria siparia CBS 279.74]|uniref:Zn(2)-C6 fungal-type domain-containing protein n=1 Tax=Pleomassaria siparia CBS 279.74 TaxID=1314801 RepID=A0A6G1KI05_9PLEO|nr:hypothetical protein K504DRAFT_531255 [Pleomassaria siparia CBS 279.74]